MNTDPDGCIVCGAPLPPLDAAGPADGLCADARCRRARLREMRRLEREAVVARAHALRRSGAAEAGVDDPASFAPAVVPAFAGRAGPLPGWRRRLFTEHVRRIARAVVTGGEAGAIAAAGPTTPTTRPDRPPEELAPDLAAVLGQACALCRGHCCRNGGEHAYLSPIAIRRYAAAHPGADAEAIVAAYAAHLGPRSYTGSCVYHRPGGCSLPREMRSDTCNRYLCPEITQLRRDLPGGGPVRAFLVSSRPGATIEGAFVDARTVRTVRRRLPLIDDSDGKPRGGRPGG